MRSITIYAAGPIDLATADQPLMWRKMLVEELNTAHIDLAFVMFDPSSAYKIDTHCMPHMHGGEYLEHMNNEAIGAADVVIAYVPKSTASVGTPIEIDLAHRIDKGLIILSDIPYGKSFYLTNRTLERNYVRIDPNKPESVQAAIIQLGTLIYDLSREK